MKVTVIGIEHTAGVSTKGKGEYDIGTLHILVELAPAFNATSLNKGFAGHKLKADGVLLRKLQNMPFPVVCEVTTKDLMMFGKVEPLVMDVVPVTHTKVAA